MLNTSRLMGFLATTKPSDAKRFYQETLGLTLLEDSPFAFVFDANGTQLRVQKVQSVSVPGYTVLGWQVENIQALALQLNEKGVAFERYDGLPQDELGVWSTPDGSRVAWFKDPEGNTLSLTEFAP